MIKMFLNVMKGQRDDASPLKLVLIQLSFISRFCVVFPRFQFKEKFVCCKIFLENILAQPRCYAKYN